MNDNSKAQIFINILERLFLSSIRKLAAVVKVRTEKRNKNTGAKKEMIDEKESSNGLICPYCKTMNPPGSKWCMVDGSNLK